MDTEDKKSPGKLDLPEPPSGMGSGFLTDYWQSQEPLPKIRGFEVPFYYLSQGVRTVVALPTSSMITIFTIAISLLLFAGFLLIVQDVAQVLQEAGSSLYLTAYLKDDAPEGAVTDFIRELENNSRIRSVKYITKAEALTQFRGDLGPRGSILEGLEDKNPLPASVDIVLRAEDGGTNAEALVTKLRQVPVVEEVAYGSEWVERAQGVLNVFRLFGLITLLIALAVIIFLISNTIKLVIYARRDEIGIMQLVGASDNFVRVPFVIGGTIQGLVGSIIGLVCLRVCFFLVRFELKSSSIIGISLPDFAFLNGWTIAGIVMIGFFVGAVGSFFALGRFMNV